jgi:hypothetical protein
MIPPELSDVLPNTPVNDAPCRAVPNLIPFRDCPQRSALGSKGPHFPNFVVGKFCCSYLGSAFVAFGVPYGSVVLTTRHTPALSRIPHIVGVSTEAEVGRIDARRVIATVADITNFEKWTVCEFVCNAVGKNSPVVDIDPTVAVRISPTNPEPTVGGIVGLLNLRPKALFEGESFSILTRHFLNLLHRFGGVTPRAVDAAPRFLIASIIPYFERGGSA